MGEFPMFSLVQGVKTEVLNVVPLRRAPASNTTRCGMAPSLVVVIRRKPTSQASSQPPPHGVAIQAPAQVARLRPRCKDSQATCLSLPNVSSRGLRKVCEHEYRY